MTLAPTNAEPAAVTSRGPKRSIRAPTVSVIGVPTTQKKVMAPEICAVLQPCSAFSAEM